MIVIDNSAGSLEASDPHQNPLEPQRPWLAAALADARARGIPSIVVGSRDLNTRFSPRLNIADRRRRHGPAAGRRRRLRLLLRAAGGEPRLPDPGRRRAETIPSFGTGTLAYRSARHRSRAATDQRRLALRRQRLPARGGRRLTARPDHQPRAGRRAHDPADRGPLDPGRRRHAAAAQPPGAVPGPRAAAARGGPLGRSSAQRQRRTRPARDPYVSFPPEQCLVAGCCEPCHAGVRVPLLGPGHRRLREAGPAARRTCASRSSARDDKPVTDSQLGPLLRLQRRHHDGHGARRRPRVLAGRARSCRAACSGPCGTRPLRPDRFRRARARRRRLRPPPPAPRAARPPVSFQPPPPPAAAGRRRAAEPPPPSRHSCRVGPSPAGEPLGFLPPVAARRVPRPRSAPEPAERRPRPRGREAARGGGRARGDRRPFARYQPDEAGLAGRVRARRARAGGARRGDDPRRAARPGTRGPARPRDASTASYQRMRPIR